MERERGGSKETRLVLAGCLHALPFKKKPLLCNSTQLWRARADLRSARHPAGRQAVREAGDAANAAACLRSVAEAPAAALSGRTVAACTCVEGHQLMDSSNNSLPGHSAMRQPLDRHIALLQQHPAPTPSVAARLPLSACASSPNLGLCGYRQYALGTASWLQCAPSPAFPCL